DLLKELDYVYWDQIIVKNAEKTLLLKKALENFKEKVKEFLIKYLHEKKISLLMVTHQEGIEYQDIANRVFTLP
ncbi:hypothetical protein, partial [Escherichia coli]|uniref:hypothetical protein n=1 Tax=Escherichia coli TaxID=562 RepID=UPI00196163C8